MDTIVYKFGDNIYINLTNRCSNACNFCLRGQGEGIGGNKLWLKAEPTSDEVIGELKKIDLKEYTEVVFCGYGEPTYKIDEILKIGQYLKSQGAKIRLDTNGQGNLINGYDTVPALSQILDKVSVSLNQCNAEKYDNICHCAFGQSGFDALIEFAQSCQKNGIETRFTVVDVIPKEDLEKCKIIAKNMNIDLFVRSLII